MAKEQTKKVRKTKTTKETTQARPKRKYTKKPKVKPVVEQVEIKEPIEKTQLVDPTKIGDVTLKVIEPIEQSWSKLAAIVTSAIAVVYAFGNWASKGFPTTYLQDFIDAIKNLLSCF
jgi:hypothetical protein